MSIRFHEGQELRSIKTGFRYEYIKPVDDNMAWCKLLPTIDEPDDTEHIGTISIDRLEPVEKRN